MWFRYIQMNWKIHWTWKAIRQAEKIMMIRFLLQKLCHTEYAILSFASYIIIEYCVRKECKNSLIQWFCFERFSTVGTVDKSYLKWSSLSLLKHTITWIFLSKRYLKTFYVYALWETQLCFTLITDGRQTYKSFKNLEWNSLQVIRKKELLKLNFY